MFAGFTKHGQPELALDPIGERGAVLAVAEREVVRLRRARTRRTRASSSPCPCRPRTRRHRSRRTAGRRARAGPGWCRPRRTDRAAAGARRRRRGRRCPGRATAPPSWSSCEPCDLERRRQRGGVARDQLARLVGEQPPALGVIATGNDLVALGIERARDGDRGDARDVVLGRPAAEHEHHPRALRSDGLTTAPGGPRGCRGP